MENKNIENKNIENKDMENKNLNNEPENKVSEDEKQKDKIVAELDDEALNKVAGGDSTQRKCGRFKPIIL